jgi:hypothetical protein
LNEVLSGSGRIPCIEKITPVLVSATYHHREDVDHCLAGETKQALANSVLIALYAMDWLYVNSNSAGLSATPRNFRKNSTGCLKRGRKMIQTDAHMRDQPSKEIQELTLLLLSLTSWSEKTVGVKLRRAWKGYDFDVLDQLYDEGLISGSRKAKSVYLTEDGIAKAEELARKYLKGDS